MKLDRQAPSITPGNEAPPKAVLVLEDGTDFRGRGLGAFGQALGEVCFNTSMTGYQEILTDPSYAGQIINGPLKTAVPRETASAQATSSHEARSASGIAPAEVDKSEKVDAVSKPV